MTAPDDDTPDDDTPDDEALEDDLEGAGWLDGLAGYLAELGLVAYRPDGNYPPDTAWPVYLEHLPDTPDQAISLTGYAGDEAPASVPGHEPRVQVMVRGGPDPRVSRQRAEAVFEHLRNLAGGAELADGTWLVTAPDVNGAVVALGVDGNRRHRHVTNHRLTIGDQQR